MTDVELPEALTAHLDGIRALCVRYRIRALHVFGSAVHGDFDPETSDLDFVVDVGNYEDDVLGRFIGFHEAVSALVGRKVDVLTIRSSGNERFLIEMHSTKVLLYAA